MNKPQPQRNSDTLNSPPSFVLWPISHPSASGKPTCCPHSRTGRAERVRVRDPVGRPSLRASCSCSKWPCCEANSRKQELSSVGFVGSEGLLHPVGVGHGLEIPFCQSWVSPRIFRAQDMQDTGYRARSLPGFLGSFTKASCKASKNRAGGGGK